MDWQDIFPFLTEGSVKQRKIMGSLLTLMGVVLWLYLIATYQVWWVHPDNIFGLYQVIPIWFWLGIFSLISGIIIMIDCVPKYFFMFQIIILNIMVWVTPVLIEPNARVTDPWNHFENVSLILSYGHIPSSDITLYMSWPGTFLYSAIGLEMSGIHSYDFLKYYPIFSSIIFLLGYYVLIQHISKNDMVRKLALLTHILMNAWLQFHFSPQSIGLIIFPLIIIALYFKSSRIWQITGLLLILSLIISHPTTCIYLGGIIFSMVLWNYYKEHYIQRVEGSTPKSNIMTFIMLAIFIVITLSLISINSFTGDFSYIIDSIVTLPTTLGTLISGWLGNPISTLRLILFLLFGLFSIMYLFVHRRDKDLKGIYIGWIVGISLAFIAAIAYSGSHLHNRGLFFYFMILVPLAFMFILSSKIKLKKNMKFIPILVAILLFLSIINMSSIFNVENEAIISDSNLGASIFLVNRTTNETIYAEQGATVMTGFASDRNIRALSARGDFINNSILVFDDYALASNIVGKRINFLYDQFQDNVTTNKFYDNGAFEAYTYRP